MVIDECQYCKSPNTKRTKALFGRGGIVSRAARVWLLTGTPFPNNLIDCWAPFSFCAYYTLGKYWEFAHRYCYVKDTVWGKQVSGARNVVELASRVRPILHRDKVEEVLAELPGFQEVIIPLEHTPKSRELCRDGEEYKEAVRAAIVSGHPEALVGVPHISTIRRELGIEKVPQAANFIFDLLDQNLPLVIFAHHQKVVADLVGLISAHIPLKDIGVIVGGTDSNLRTQHVKNFQDGHLRCLVLSIKAAGVGITLTRARIAVFVEVDWVPATLEQAQARIRRIGQKSFCTYYYLHFPDSLDETVYEALKSKQGDIEKFWTAWDKGTEPEEERINWD